MEPTAPRLRVPADGQQATLALQASLAAIALDARRRSRDASLEPVSDLVALLRTAVEPVTPVAGQAERLLDPLAAELLNRALALTHHAESATSLPEVSAKVTELIQRLERVSETTANEELDELKAFCLALSESAQLEMPSVFLSPNFPELFS